MKIGREELTNCLIYQIGALKGFLDAEGMVLNHLKPHGSLYGMAARDEAMAHAICDAADIFKVPLLGMRGTLHETIYAARGHDFVSEFYADLDYADDGSLIITREHHAKDPRRRRCDLPPRDAGRDRVERGRGCGEGRRGYDLRPFGYAECGRHRVGCARRRSARRLKQPEGSASRRRRYWRDFPRRSARRLNRRWRKREPASRSRL